MVCLEKIMWRQRLAAVVLGIEDTKGLVKIVSLDTNQFAPLSNESGKLAALFFRQSVEGPVKSCPHSTDRVIRIIAAHGIFGKIQKAQNYTQR